MLCLLIIIMFIIIIITILLLIHYFAITIIIIVIIIVIIAEVTHPSDQGERRACTSAGCAVYRELRGSQGMGVVRNNWLLLCFIIHSLHVQTLMLTNVQTPFLGTPLVPLKHIYIYIYIIIMYLIYL